mmetsp:Transcript_46240/g.99850  ORF Transcript_46240/g.99850 Transcript_46240/m.99850 type:complete len:583 (+) Transcript_46240:217-1965(+)|eukprot:CAMPEP_0206546722 /NCGR_PEP_ID=MMETSP0325_2-20121206/12887_1 /ASSEMBLY_ACC=CAM_ASM_000347 /TAXON_ID=2866 /ORGANISM="Crypthecodinium cohnii, Strain Seligo" /LENGTH=582 /DNA_ID=CAMNT_0054045925 /DNA_START=205 /DNA_END=1953 /DNA_ORIENTATION=+
MAGLCTLMNLDDGARRADIIALPGGEKSPVRGVENLGNSTFCEPLERNVAETHLLSDLRSERHTSGLVKWSTEPHVPDVGGLGWRTKAGHLLKNQSYYPQVSSNLWNNPTFAGVNTWKEYHGPRLRADAEMMERLDQFDADEEEWSAKKTFVNTTRVETLDRFYNRKHQRSQQETSTSWAPHIRSKREYHSSYETFDSNMDEKPRQQLKRIFTDQVLKADRDAIRQIASRVQNEETWREVYKMMESERRNDLRADLQHRQAHTDRLMMLSGQPVRQRTGRSRDLSASQRVSSLSKPRDVHRPKDITAQTDFRGLIHADNAYALEALFPGQGHHLSTEFRERATASAAPGWPPPPRAETPKIDKSFKKRSQEVALSKLSIPSSFSRLDAVEARSGDEDLLGHSMSQFLSTVAAPAPDQDSVLLKQDFSPSATKERFRRSTMSKRSWHKMPDGTPTGNSVENQPPARHPYVYPMAVPTSPGSRKRVDQNGLLLSKPKHLCSSASAPLLLAADTTQTTFNQTKKKQQQSSSKELSKSLCEELDAFEEKAATLAASSSSSAFADRPRPSKSRCADPPPPSSSSSPA